MEVCKKGICYICTKEVFEQKYKPLGFEEVKANDKPVQRKRKKKTEEVKEGA